MSKDDEHQLSKCVLSVAGSSRAKVSTTASCHIGSDLGDAKEWCMEDNMLQFQPEPGAGSLSFHDEMIITTMQLLNFRQ